LRLAGGDEDDDFERFVFSYESQPIPIQEDTITLDPVISKIADLDPSQYSLIKNEFVAKNQKWPFDNCDLEEWNDKIHPLLVPAPAPIHAFHIAHWQDVLPPIDDPTFRAM
jgi:hypothetical protein